MPAPEPAPEVETLTVAENKVEQTHSLDLPEVNYGEEEAGTNLSELEAEFAEVFSTIGVDENVQITEGQSEADRAFEDIFRESASTYMPNSGMAAAGQVLRRQRLLLPTDAPGLKLHLPLQRLPARMISTITGPRRVRRPWNAAIMASAPQCRRKTIWAARRKLTAIARFVVAVA